METIHAGFQLALKQGFSALDLNKLEFGFFDRRGERVLVFDRGGVMGPHIWNPAKEKLKPVTMPEGYEDIATSKTTRFYPVMGEPKILCVHKGDTENRFVVFNLKTGEVVAQHKGPEAIHVSNQGTRILLFTEKPEGQKDEWLLMNAATGSKLKLVQRTKGRGAPVSITVSQDGKKVAVHSRLGSGVEAKSFLYVIKREGFDEDLGEFTADVNGPENMSFGGRLLATGAFGGKFTVYDVATKEKEIETGIGGSTDQLTSTSEFSPSGKVLKAGNKYAMQFFATEFNGDSNRLQNLKSHGVIYNQIEAPGKYPMVLHWMGDKHVYLQITKERGIVIDYDTFIPLAEVSHGANKAIVSPDGNRILTLDGVGGNLFVTEMELNPKDKVFKLPYSVFTADKHLAFVLDKDENGLKLEMMHIADMARRAGVELPPPANLQP